MVSTRRVVSAMLRSQSFSRCGSTGLDAHVRKASASRNQDVEVGSANRRRGYPNHGIARILDGRARLVLPCAPDWTVIDQCLHGRCDAWSWGTHGRPCRVGRCHSSSSQMDNRGAIHSILECWTHVYERISRTTVSPENRDRYWTFENFAHQPRDTPGRLIGDTCYIERRRSSFLAGACMTGPVEHNARSSHRRTSTREPS
jgi:hypothetical protein